MKVGTRLGPYEITAKLGEGGMGEVWRAVDTRLRRDVAIKVLPQAFTADGERVARFEREAKLLAQLHHPNIASIFGLEDSAAGHALVMELVEGPTLAERLARGALPLDETITIARQIAEALEEAHEKGIVHRDLKPQNVKASPDGRVKVLDFGLAKAMGPLAGTASASQLEASPTLTLGGTVEGIILGTAAYMSPEQAKGLPVDKRTDIWAFGVVLYEMSTGRRLFRGDGVAETLAGVLRAAIDFQALPAATPPAIRRLLRRCLERDPKARLRDIGDARGELAGLATTSGDEGSSAVRRGWSSRRGGRAAVVSVTLALGAALGALGWRALGPDPPARRGVDTPLRLSVVLPHDLRLEGFDLTPDARSLVVLATERTSGTAVGPRRLYVRALARPEVLPLPGTEEAVQSWPSADSRWVYFVGPTAPGEGSMRIARVPIDGSAPPVTVAPWDPAWVGFGVLPTGELVVTLSEPPRFLRLPAWGGPPPAPIAIDADVAPMTLVEPTNRLLPDGRMIVNAHYYRSGRYENAVGALDLDSGELRLLVEDAFEGFVGGDGELLFGRGDALLATALDPANDAARAAPRVVSSGARGYARYQHPMVSVAAQGRVIAFPPGGLPGRRRRLVRIDPGGEPRPWLEDRRFFASPPSVSADGRRVAVSVRTADRDLFEIWITDLEGTLLRQVQSHPGVDAHWPRLSADGSLLAFESVGAPDQDGTFVVGLDAADEPRRIVERRGLQHPTSPSWSPDGEHLLIGQTRDGQADVVLYRVDAAPDSPGVPLLVTPASELFPSFSPDGRSILFLAVESGRAEVRVCRFSAPGVVGPSYPVSRGPVAEQSPPRWRRDGKAIYFSDGGHIVSVAVSLEPRFSVAAPVPVVDLDALRLHDLFDVLPGGGLIVVQKDENEGNVAQIDVVVGSWLEAKSTGPGRL